MTGKRVPDWALERYLVGELPPEFSEADVAADPTAQERLARLRASDEEILARHQPRVVAANVRQRAEERLVSGRPAMTRWVPIAAAAGLVAVVALVAARLQQQPDVPDILTKGLEPHLEVYRQGPGGNELLATGAVGRPGDVIQLRIVPAGAQFGAVVAVDSSGAATLVAPAQEGPALELPRGRSLSLADALQLDAAGDLERFFLVTSDRPFQTGDVLAAAGKLGPGREVAMELPSGLKQSAFLIVKQR